MKKDVYIPYDEDENFFSTITIPGFDAYAGDDGDLPEGVLGVYELSRRADYLTVCEFAKNITDDFSEDVPLFPSQTEFSRMSLPQMRRYFTLRENFRKGRYECKFDSYLTVYLTEIINLVGIPTYEKAASEIASVMTERTVINKNYLPLCKGLFRDFYVAFNIPGSFYEFAENYGVEKYFPDSVIPENTDVRAAVFYHNADYHIPKTTGFFAQHFSAEGFLRKTFFSVMKNLEPLLRFIGKPIKALEADYFGRFQNYKPFSGVKFYKTPTRVGKAVITPSESYVVSDGIIKASLVNFPKSAAIFFGFILTVIEANMRVLCNYKYLLTIDADSVLGKIYETYDKDFRFYLGLMNSDELSRIITQTVSDLYQKSVRFIITNGVSGCSKTSEELRKKLSAEPFLTHANLREKNENRKSDPIEIFKTESDELWDFSGNFGEDNFTFGSYARISQLSPKDFATYISVRTRIKNGDLTGINDFFWLIWLSELINTEKITPEEVFAKFASYLPKLPDPKIKATMVQYYVLHLSEKGSFREFADKNGVTEFFTEVFASGDYSFSEMNEISEYKITKSKFYNEKTAQIFSDLTPKLFAFLCRYFNDCGVDFKKLLYETDTHYEGFYDGLIAPRTVLPEKTEIKISETLKFIYHYGNQFERFYRKPESKIMPVFIGLIMKNAEIALREIIGAKSKISISEKIPEKLRAKLNTKITPRDAKTKTGKAELLQWKMLFSAVLNNEFAPLIKRITEKVVAETAPETPLAYKLKPIPIKVEINFDELGEIRAESKEVALRLGAVYEEKEIEKPSENTSESPQIPQGKDDINKAFLSFLLNGKNSEAMEFALQSGTMFEVIAEQINEIFSEKIGDIVIENGEIISDYIEDVKNFIGE